MEQTLIEILEELRKQTAIMDARMAMPKAPKKRGPNYTLSALTQDRVAQALGYKPLAFGVLCNRFRTHDKSVVQSVLNTMVANGSVATEVTAHPVNGKVTTKYRLANMPQGPEEE